MRCISCNYDLKRLREHRCPECGREFDPRDPSSYVIVRLASRSGRLAPHLCCLVAGLALAFGSVYAWDHIHFDGWKQTLMDAACVTVCFVAFGVIFELPRNIVRRSENR